MKVVFIGHPGSGKTYAATNLAKRIGVKEIDIDALLHNWIYFLFRRPYRGALHELLKDKTSWIIDGYAGKRLPASLWDEADHIVYINLPKSELKQNLYNRYRLKKTNKARTHGQELFTNVLKNLWQIYMLDHSLKGCIHSIRHSPNANKLVEVCSRQDLSDLLGTLSS
jgi:adenylate kinase family enzyme